MGEGGAIYKVYAMTGLCQLSTVVEEFELVDWLYWCAGWAYPYPRTDKVRPSQLSYYDGGQEIACVLSNHENYVVTRVMTNTEKQKENEKQIQALSSWAWKRVRCGMNETTQFSLQDPEWPPEVVWGMMQELMGTKTADAVRKVAEARGKTHRKKKQVGW